MSTGSFVWNLIRSSLTWTLSDIVARCPRIVVTVFPGFASAMVAAPAATATTPEITANTSLRLRFIALSSDWCDRCSEPHIEGAARLRRQQASSEGGWHRVAEGARVLDAGNAMTDNSRKVVGGQVEALNAS